MPVIRFYIGESSDAESDAVAFVCVERFSLHYHQMLTSTFTPLTICLQLLPGKYGN
jgi:hypothetical protein